ncbi:MAG: hypothetical protein JSU82_16685 [Rhodospirillales bacterium]|nr:MAG: hypothetical protein JSU82_16685 [Rhodospirillales bacterium]
MPMVVHRNAMEVPSFGGMDSAPTIGGDQLEEALRAVQITLLFVFAMLYLGAQAAQTEPNRPPVTGNAAQTITTAASR